MTTLTEQVAGNGKPVTFDYLKMPGEPLVGLVLCENDNGDRYTLLGDPRVVALWSKTLQTSQRRRTRVVLRLVEKTRWTAKRGWPENWRQSDDG